jgi:hypothetical protein
MNCPWCTTQLPMEWGANITCSTLLCHKSCKSRLIHLGISGDEGWVVDSPKERGWGVSFPPLKHFMITQHVHCLVDNAKNCDVRSNDSVGDHKKIWHELQMFQLEITKICDVNFICFSWRSQTFVMWASHVLVGDQNYLWHVINTSNVLVVLHKKICAVSFKWLGWSSPYRFHGKTFGAHPYRWVAKHELWSFDPKL